MYIREAFYTLYSFIVTLTSLAVTVGRRLRISRRRKCRKKSSDMNSAVKFLL